MVTPKAPVPLLVPRVAVTSSQTMVWRWESTDGAYRKALGMTRHPMLAWAPQSAGDREFAPRHPNLLEDTPSPPPTVYSPVPISCICLQNKLEIPDPLVWIPVCPCPLTAS